jgi:hypothetical protein
MVYVAKMTDYDNEFVDFVELESKGWSVIGTASKYYGDDCQAGVNYYTIVHDGLTTDELTAIVEERYYATHCQHAHDCCGHTYTSKGKLLFNNDDTALVEQGWHVNI